MELRVQLKVCEGCGCLWYRPLSLGSSYCRECRIRLSDFAVSTRRPRRYRLSRPAFQPQPCGGAE